MATANAFRKGEQVTYIGSWDDKGTFYFQQATVYSCGKKQMVLTDAADGTEMGRHYRPEIAGPEHFHGTHKLLTDSEAEAACIALATKYVEATRRDYEHRVSREGEDAAYAQAMRKAIAEIHEPRAIKRTGTWK